eukprot:TRINITY_DN6448_c0_g1_i1.p1 TRINITY_DN6448_c0_g1~~TRINITY_DN6448_c0_g1_i1.p1  ORF type:complete len:199 (+),score=73.70 TRINITY_DN6448_c0_g1_i1:172-768(+)
MTSRIKRDTKPVQRYGEAAVDKKKAIKTASIADSGPKKKIVKKPVTKRGKAAGTAKKATRAKKDPDAPKRAKNGYMFFVEAQRSKVKADNPTMSFGDITKTVSALWRGLSKDDRVPYEKQAQDDKARYAKAKQEYDTNKAPDAATTVTTTNNKKKRTAAPKKKKSADQSDEDDEDDNDDDDSAEEEANDDDSSNEGSD